MPGISGGSKLARYWTLTNSSVSSADLTFTYLPTDIVGNEGNYQFIKKTVGTLSILAPASPPSNTSATINGVTSFSDWTLAEAAAVQSGTIQFSSASYNVGEGDGNASIIVTRSGGTDGDVSVHYATSDAAAGSSDYTSQSGTFNWLAGDSTTRTITVPINNDGIYEGLEDFNVDLDTPGGGATLGSPSGAVVTITENDALPSFSIDDVTHNEGDAGTTMYVFTITKTGATALNSEVNFTTVNGSATLADNDYQSNANTLNFLPGETTEQITVLVNGDTTVEPDEVFTVNLNTPVDATISDADGTGTITNDDVSGETDVAVSGGNLVITDANGSTTADTLTISLVGLNVRITDPSNTLTAGAGATQFNPNTVEVTLASISGGNIQVNTLGGNDTLTLALAGGDFIPAGGLSYAGGTQTSVPGDKLVITGGAQGTVTYNYTNANDGSVVMSAFGTVSYTGLEPITNSGTAADIIFNLPAGPNAVVLGDDGTGGNTISRLSAPTIETTDFANPTGSVTINRGSATDAFLSTALPDFNASLTIGSGLSPFGSIDFNSAITLAANKNLTVNASDTINLPSPASVLSTTGSGTISLTTTVDITLSVGSSISVVDGALNLSANQQAVPTTTNFEGIALNGATLTTSGTGNIVLLGKGGANAGDSLHRGIHLTGGSAITSTSGVPGAGTITLNGIGGPGIASNTGVEVEQPATAVTSVIGDISITGQGGAGTGANNFGVHIESGAVVTSTGAAKITIDGTGGTSALANSRGIGVRVADDTSQVASSGGDIAITGQGANGGSGNYGVSLAFGGLISATGGATITIDGTGGTGTDSLSGVIVSRFDAGTNAPSRIISDSGDIEITGIAGNGTSLGNIGINTDTGARIVATGPANVILTGSGGGGTSDCYGIGVEGGNEAGTAVSSVNGNIVLTGTGGSSAGTDMDGVRFEDSVAAQAVAVTTTGTGSVTINGTAGNSDSTSAGINIVDDCTMTFTGATNSFIADSMDLGSSAVSINAGANALILGVNTNGMAIDLGGADSATQLGLTDTELDLITAGTLNFGDSNSGAITVSDNLSRAAATVLNLTSGANIDIATGSLDSNGGNISLSPFTYVFPSNTGVDVTTGATETLSLGSGKDLKIDIDGTVIDTGYTQLNVAGLVNLNGANLSFAGSTYTPVGGEFFTIVENDGDTDAITGTFAGLPEGATIANFLGSGLNATISYVDGDDNDVVIFVEPDCTPPSTVYVDDDWVGTTIGTDPDGGDPATNFGCDSFATIQEGIDGVSSGGTVIVRPGTYPESVLINKPVTLEGAEVGQNANARFGTFVVGPDGPKANPAVESIITAAAVNPNNSVNNPIHIMSSNVIVDGFVVDGNNPALGAGGAVVVGGVNTHARRGIQTDNAAGTVFFPANSVQIKNNVVQNFVSHAVQLINGADSASAPATSFSLIDGNVVRNFGGGNGSPGTAGSGIVLRFNAHADITNNTVVTNGFPTEAGIWIQDFVDKGTPHTLNITTNNITVGQDNFGGIWVNLAHVPDLNIDSNTVNAASGVTGTSDLTFGIYLSSLRPGTIANLNSNTVGTSGGEFSRGIALWNLGTATTTVTGGTVGNSLRGVSLHVDDPNFGLAGQQFVSEHERGEYQRHRSYHARRRVSRRDQLHRRYRGDGGREQHHHHQYHHSSFDCRHKRFSRRSRQLADHPRQHHRDPPRQRFAYDDA